MKKVKY